MASVVEIANMALSRIGHSQKIDSLNERSAAAEQCNLFYAQTRDFVLRAEPWPFATKFVQLAAMVVNPDPAYDYSYALPADCLMARRIVNQLFPVNYWPYPGQSVGVPLIPNTPFRIIQGDSTRLISTSVSPATLEYTVRIEDPGFFDPTFVSALAWKLAAELAIPLAKDASVAQTCEQAYQAIVAQAFTIGMTEGQGQRFPDSVFITGRGL